ncbi:hypothetical protein HDU97_004596 [Phlyctochytrium planicorne]|nr:hypothetical protein HDU97_004596 [Phlyctochytrium planicorne]
MHAFAFILLLRLFVLSQFPSNAHSHLTPLIKPLHIQYSSSHKLLRPNRYHVLSSTGSPSTSLLTGGTLLTGCSNTRISVNGTEFYVAVDSGSADLILPGQSLNAYDGPRYNTNGKRPVSVRPVETYFADGSMWQGRIFTDRVRVGSEEGVDEVIVGFAVAEKQTASPFVMDGTLTQGLLGLSYDSLSILPPTTPPLLTTLNLTNHLPNSISFRSCPASSSIPSYLDWGSTDTSLTCTSTLWTDAIRRDHHVVSVGEIRIGPERFVGGDAIVDSCTTTLILPQDAYDGFVSMVNQSGVLQRAGVSEFDAGRFLTNLYSLSEPKERI